MTRCCLILGDQLSTDLSALQTLEPQDVVLMAEVWSKSHLCQPPQAKNCTNFFGDAPLPGCIETI
jgi:Uncharacterized protein related to deoxyribodipyrimidine photolyase